MPEGPEIRRAADAVAGVLEGHTIEAVTFGLPDLKSYESLLAGHKVTAVETRGKAMLTHFDNGYTIYSHNQLYGLWKVVRKNTKPQTNRTLRLALETRTHRALLFSASDISVWRFEDLDDHPFLARIGPDILNPGLTWQDVRARLESPLFSRRSLVSLYLDQAFIAGIGNYLRSEILFDAKIHPWQKPADLSRRELGTLARSTLKIARRSYETGGRTNPSSTGRPTRFAVFAREDEPCYRCGAGIVKTPAGSRRLYWCPGCQPG